MGNNRYNFNDTILKQFLKNNLKENPSYPSGITGGVVNEKGDIWWKIRELEERIKKLEAKNEK